MAGVALTDEGLVVDRPSNRLDELAIGFSEILSRQGIDHAFVAGYVAILTGRPRSTDDIDVFIECCSEARIEELVEQLDAEILGSGDAAVRDARDPLGGDEHLDRARERDDATSGGEVSRRQIRQGLIVILASHSGIDRPTMGGRTGKQSH